ncbi:MAG TPA: hypothetical protein VIJ02_14970 [Thermoanaerobaculia bacterium]
MHRTSGLRARPGRHLRFPSEGIAPHVVSADNFLKELEWAAHYNGHPAFMEAWRALFDQGIVMRCRGARADGQDEVRWFDGFRLAPGFGDPDLYRKLAPSVAETIRLQGWKDRYGAAWAVATFNLPNKTFDSAVARLRKELRALRESRVVF